VAAHLAVKLPEREFLIALAVLILIMTWIRPGKMEVNHIPRFFWVGLFVGFLSPITGAVGPALAPFLMHRTLNRDQLVTTQAACVGCIDTMKVLWFVAFGFALRTHLALILGLVAAVVIGSFLGTKFRRFVSEQWFRPMLRWVITISAVHVLVTTLMG
jgi:uncharacterized membrane protein YfcA